MHEEPYFIFVRILSDQNYDGVGIENNGNLSALHTEIRADGNLYEYAIHYSGEIDAFGIEEVSGEIFLVAEEGLTEVHGSVRATGESGGTIHLLGKGVGLDREIAIDVSSEKDEGTVFYRWRLSREKSRGDQLRIYLLWDCFDLNGFWEY